MQDESTHISLSDVRSALAHLDDPAYLESHALGQALQVVTESPGISRGQVLRRVLRLSIEELDPGPHVPPSSAEGRPYHVLSRHYVTKQSIAFIGDALGVSERQAYRELNRALTALVRILASMDGRSPERPSRDLPNGADSSVVREAFDRISSVEPQDVDLGRLIADAVSDLSQLARDRGVVLEYSDSPSIVTVQYNRIALRQAILNLLSQSIQTHQARTIVLRLTREGDTALLTCEYQPVASYEPTPPAQPGGVANQLFGLLGIELDSEHFADGRLLVRIRIPVRRGHILLVIDDNAGFGALVRRYLRDQPFRVYAALDYREALQTMQKVSPDVILLDVMMPAQDGWEILKSVRSHAAGRRARVIVCSIIDDPDLAYALGADGFLHKPVSRADLVQSLTRVMLSA